MRLLSLVMISATLLLPGLAAAQDATAQNVRVRGGEHAGFNRVVFDWRTPVPYRVESGSGQATLVFERRATLDLSRYRVNPPPLFRRLSPRGDGDQLSVHIRFPAGARLRHFVYGPKVVVDVYAPPMKAAMAAPVRPAAAMTRTPSAPPAEPAG
jgi:hypothetical protein